jgi:hypothetical protein
MCSPPMIRLLQKCKNDSKDEGSRLIATTLILEENLDHYGSILKKTEKGRRVSGYSNNLEAFRKNINLQNHSIMGRCTLEVKNWIDSSKIWID